MEQLRTMLKSKKLDTTGKKADLVKRLEEHKHQQQQQQDAGASHCTDTATPAPAAMDQDKPEAPPSSDTASNNAATANANGAHATKVMSSCQFAVPVRQIFLALHLSVGTCSAYRLRYWPLTTLVTP